MTLDENRSSTVDFEILIIVTTSPFGIYKFSKKGYCKRLTNPLALSLTGEEVTPIETLGSDSDGLLTHSPRLPRRVRMWVVGSE